MRKSASRFATASLRAENEEAQSPPVGLPAKTVVCAQTVWYVTGDNTCRMKAHKHPCAPRWTLNATLQRELANREAYVEVYLVDVINPKLADVLIDFANHYPSLLSTPY